MRTLIILLFISFSGFSQQDIERYKLYPTDNINIFLKLDTSTGLVDMVQKSSNDVDDRITAINFMPIAYDQEDIDLYMSRGDSVNWEFLNQHSKSDEPLLAQVGRFKLYPTQNIWTFLMQDVISGHTYQVQWGFDFEQRMLFLIE